MGHIRGYVERKQEGVVVLFLAGSEGSGKTLTIDTFRDVNPKWKKIVAIHEQVGQLSFNRTRIPRVFSVTIEEAVLDSREKVLHLIARHSRVI